MAPSVAQLESAVADPVQVAKDAAKSQSTESKVQDDVADKVRTSIHFNSCELMFRIRDPPIPSTSLTSTLTRNSPRQSFLVSLPS
jgi:hypothetical protein